jgi:hypothetical protein
VERVHSPIRLKADADVKRVIIMRVRRISERIEMGS